MAISHLAASIFSSRHPTDRLVILNFQYHTILLKHHFSYGILVELVILDENSFLLKKTKTNPDLNLLT